MCKNIIVIIHLYNFLQRFLLDEHLCEIGPNITQIAKLSWANEHVLSAVLKVFDFFFFFQLRQSNWTKNEKEETTTIRSTQQMC